MTMKTTTLNRGELINAPAQPAAQSRRRPRVLHLVNYFEAGGTERQAVELLKRLNPERFDVRLAALRNVGPLYKEIAEQYPAIPEFPLNSFYDLNALKQTSRLRKLLLQERIDIVHAHDFYTAILALMATPFTRVRVIACQRNLKISDRLAHRVGHRLMYRFADLLLVNSAAIREHILGLGGGPPEKIVVIRNGLRRLTHATTPPTPAAVRATLIQELNLPADAKLVGIVANLRPVKGHRYFLEAAAQVSHSVPEAHFVLVGEGPLRSEIEAQAAQFGISSRVHILGYRPDAALLQTAFDVAVLASLHEGLPNSVMEAMAAGVPVVATAVGGTKELVTDEETGYLVPPADAEAMALRILRALQHPIESAALAARGQLFVNTEFNMERMVTAVETLYSSLDEPSRTEI